MAAHLDSRAVAAPKSQVAIGRIVWSPALREEKSDVAFSEGLSCGPGSLDVQLLGPPHGCCHHGVRSATRLRVPTCQTQRCKRPKTPSARRDRSSRTSRQTRAGVRWPIDSSCVAVLNEAERREGRSAAAQRDALEIDDSFHDNFSDLGDHISEMMQGTAHGDAGEGGKGGGEEGGGRRPPCGAPPCRRP